MNLQDLLSAYPSRKDGWYSEQAAERYGTIRYSSIEGQVVEVTCVGDGDGYMWPDKRFVGKVTRYLGKGRSGRYRR